MSGGKENLTNYRLHGFDSFAEAANTAHLFRNALEEITAFSCSCSYWRQDCPQCIAGKVLEAVASSAGTPALRASGEGEK